MVMAVAGKLAHMSILAQSHREATLIFIRSSAAVQEASGILMKTSLFVLCLMMAGSAMADEESARSCTGIADKMARLACYDAAFGDTGQRPTPPQRLTATVLSAVPLPQGLFRLTLDNGQIWETRQADWALDFKSSNSVTISRMMLGSYAISLAGQGRTVAVKRIQ
jgi:hypothetical protein